MADVIDDLNAWRLQAQQCQKWIERRLLDDGVSADERQSLQETRRSAIGMQTGLLRLIDRIASSAS